MMRGDDDDDDDDDDDGDGDGDDDGDDDCELVGQLMLSKNHVDVSKEALNQV